MGIEEEEEGFYLPDFDHTEMAKRAKKKLLKAGLSEDQADELIAMAQKAGKKMREKREGKDNA